MINDWYIKKHDIDIFPLVKDERSDLYIFVLILFEEITLKSFFFPQKIVRWVEWRKKEKNHCFYRNKHTQLRLHILLVRYRFVDLELVKVADRVCTCIEKSHQQYYLLVISLFFSLHSIVRRKSVNHFWHIFIYMYRIDHHWRLYRWRIDIVDSGK